MLDRDVTIPMFQFQLVPKLIGLAIAWFCYGRRSNRVVF